jgi:hypothetical protein
MHNGRPISLLPRTIRPPIWEHHLSPIRHNILGSGNFVTGNIHLFSHTAYDVAQAISTFIAYPPDQQRQYVIYQYSLERAREGQIPEDENLLMNYLRLFDRIFFFGALTSRRLCYIDVCVMDVDKYGDCTTHQNCQFREINSRYECRIRIRNVSQGDGFSDDKERLRHYLRVILHEAIHAMFGLYVCYHCEHCSEVAARDMEWSGHGRFWQDIAVMVENYSYSLACGRLDLLREFSFWNAPERCYLQPCREQDLRRWGFLQFRP